MPIAPSAGTARASTRSRTSRSRSTSTSTSSRALSKARNELITQLKEDHQRVKKAYARYRRLDAEQDADTREALVTQVLDELDLHARLEEELLYPAAREALEDTDQIDEAVVEHEMLHLLIGQLRELEPGSNEHQARFTVLCEYTLHHVKEEEREMFPQLMKVKLDWLQMAREFEARRTAYGADGGEQNMDDAAEDPDDAGPQGRARDEGAGRLGIGTDEPPEAADGGSDDADQAPPEASAEEARNRVGKSARASSGKASRSLGGRGAGQGDEQEEV